jgi:hypothetical protein
MADVLLDAELRKRMEARGLQRAAHFNWRKSALATLDVYREVVAECGAGANSRSAIESPVVAPLRPHGKR